jgi:sulfur carrier protein
MAAKVIVFMNGKARQVNSDRTVMEIVGEMNLEPSSVLVERNGEALLRQEWGEKKVEHGDRLEFVKVVAGG